MHLLMDKLLGSPARRVIALIVLCVVVAGTADVALLTHSGGSSSGPSVASTAGHGATSKLAPYAKPAPGMPVANDAPLVTLSPGVSVHAYDFSLTDWAPQLDIDVYGKYPPVFDPTIPRDATGAMIYSRDGQTQEHPVFRAQDGINALSSYAGSHSQADLAIAVAEGNALIASHKTYGGAWWYPYSFNFDLHGTSGDVLKAPWYSAMAQGEVLDLFVRLAQTTGASKWRQAADSTYASFTLLYNGDNTHPWDVSIDQTQYLWLQEYPGAEPDFTINGVNYALKGVIHYYLLTGNGNVKTLADAALTTMLHALPYVEHVNAVEGYCLDHETPSAHYHGVVTRQMAMMYAVTGDLRFAAWSLQLISDYPEPEVSGNVTLPAGTQTLMHSTADLANSLWTVQGKMTIALDAPTSYPVDMRIRLKDQPGFWYHLADGPYKGMFVQESDSVHLQGEYNLTSFAPSLPVTFPAGRYTTYTVGQSSVTEQATAAFAAPTKEAIDAHATIDGVTMWHVASGSLQGTWIGTDVMPHVSAASTAS